MKDFLKDKTFAIEMLSAASFFLMSIGLFISHFESPDSRTVYFWAFIFIILSGIQSLGLFFRKELWIVRLCAGWICGTTWVVLSYTVVNSSMMVPVMLIGIFNIYAFTQLISKAKIDWSCFNRRQEAHANSFQK